MQTDDDTLDLLVSIAHFARAYQRFEEARYLFDRLALLYPQRAFPCLGLGLVEVDRTNYRGALLWFRRALDLVPDSPLASAWLGACQVLDGHYSLGARTLAAVVDSDDSSASSMAAAFLGMPECAPYAGAARATHAANAAPPVGALSTIERLTIRGNY